jgi:phenylpropionate dioxygenase-like ring-hydroxylating dioxygenase large terminal subunit
MRHRGKTPAEIAQALRHSWFPVARLQDLERPVEATLLGEKLVVFRTSAGQPRVLQRRCIHRGGNLAKGEVQGDSLACPYHGWRYDGQSGRCTYVPSLEDQAKIPTRAAVRSYPARQHWGHVWTCLDEPVADLPAPPEFDELELGEWVAGPSLHSSVGLAATTENFRDVAHFPFVHRGTMGQLAHVVERLDVRRDGVDVWMTRRVEARPDAPWSDDGNAWMRYHTIAPGISLIVYEYDDLGKRVLVGCPSPIGPEECTIFWGVANDCGFNGMTAQEAMEAEHAVYLEDIPVVCDLDPAEIPFDGEAVEVSVPADRFTLAYRRAFLEFAERALRDGNSTRSGSGVPRDMPALSSHADDRRLRR